MALSLNVEMIINTLLYCQYYSFNIINPQTSNIIASLRSTGVLPAKRLRQGGMVVEEHSAWEAANATVLGSVLSSGHSGHDERIFQLRAACPAPAAGGRCGRKTGGRPHLWTDCNATG